MIWLLIVITICLLVAVVTRIAYLICNICHSECRLQREKNFRTMICIGSGGHTMEMLEIIQVLESDKFTPRYYVMADNDALSENKIHSLEKNIDQGSYEVWKIPRSRNVRQSWVTTVATTAHATLRAAPLVWRLRPDLLLCNGPGTCLPLCIIVFLLRAFFILDSRIVFIESVCRVETISFTGKLLQYIADDFIVQWPELLEVCKRAKYFGRLI